MLVLDVLDVWALMKPELKNPPANTTVASDCPAMRMVRVLWLGSTGAAEIEPRLMKLKSGLTRSAVFLPIVMPVAATCGAMTTTALEAPVPLR